MRPILSLLALAALSVNTASASDITVLGTFGYWQAYSGLADDGTRVCGLGEVGNDGRSMQIKFFEGTDHLTIQFFKPGWSIPKGTPVPAKTQFGSFSPWNVPARGFDGRIEVNVPFAQLNQFTLEFRAANQFNLIFLSGNEGAWTGQLSGSGAAMDKMYQCLRTMRGNGAATTQPFNSAPSQPFDSAPTAPQTPAPPARQEQGA